MRLLGDSAREIPPSEREIHTVNDDVAAIAGVIEHERGVIMLVGHLPFLERLAALLITGNSENGVVTLDAGSLLELTASDGWKVTCLMQPRLLPGHDVGTGCTDMLDEINQSTLP